MKSKTFKNFINFRKSKDKSKDEIFQIKMSSFLYFLIFSSFSLLISAKFLHHHAPNLADSLYNERPLIGVFAQPSDFSKQYPTNNYSYIASSYIKFIESAGARAVPIPYDLPRDQMKYLFNSLNGLIFPGGSALLWDDDTTHTALSNMTLAGQYLIELAVEANKNGDYFPVWGTCLGYELMMIAISNDKDVLDRLNSSNHVLKLEYVSDESRIFKTLDPTLKNYSETVETLYFNHHYGITPENFLNNFILTEEFFISSISHTDNGTAFVASIESKKYPFYGIQFHPEKSPFEWKKDVYASHTLEAVEISQHLGDFLIDEARKNFHKFESETIADTYTIYNYDPVKVSESFMECYFFPKPV